MRLAWSLVFTALALGCPAPVTSSALCGNGVLDPNEKCDPKIPEGQAGSCPTSCDTSVCPRPVLTGSAEACTAQCTTNANVCFGGDGCCPATCNANSDSDCAPKCGNGVIEPGEKCDGNCPTQCPMVACTTSVLNPGTGQCTAQCIMTPVTTCKSGDGCCPSGCTRESDTDCPGAIGSACTKDSECLTNTCRTATDYGVPGGICSRDCTSVPTCGSGAHCGMAVNSVRNCLKDCTQNGDCRPGYECFDSDADGMKECAPVATGTGAVGDVCATTADCAGGQRGGCATQGTSGSTNGYCTISLCNDTDSSTSNDCPTGSHCGFKNAVGVGSCVKDCTTDSQCRSVGYACYDYDADSKKECIGAGTGSSPIGGACKNTGECGEGQFVFCYLPWDQGSCMAACGPNERAVCPTNSHCVNFGSFKRCLADCTTSAGCRTGYTCRNLDADQKLECAH